jgi:GTPase
MPRHVIIGTAGHIDHGKSALVLALTGTDIAAEFRGKYDDEIGAYRVLKDHADGTLAATAEKVAAQFAMPEVPPLHAQRGDVGIIAVRDGPALAVCIGAEVCAAAPAGIEFFSIRNLERAWRV